MAIVAAMRIDEPDLSRIGCAFFVTKDRGPSWTRHDLDVTPCVGPWTAFAQAGRALVRVSRGTAWLNDTELMFVWADARTGLFRLYSSVVRVARN